MLVHDDTLIKAIRHGLLANGSPNAAAAIENLVGPHWDTDYIATHGRPLAAETSRDFSDKALASPHAFVIESLKLARVNNEGSPKRIADAIRFYSRFKHRLSSLPQLEQPKYADFDVDMLERLVRSEYKHCPALTPPEEMRRPWVEACLIYLIAMSDRLRDDGGGIDNISKSFLDWSGQLMDNQINQHKACLQAGWDDATGKWRVSPYWDGPRNYTHIDTTSASSRYTITVDLDGGCAPVGDGITDDTAAIQDLYDGPDVDGIRPRLQVDYAEPAENVQQPIFGDIDEQEERLFDEYLHDLNQHD